MNLFSIIRHLWRRDWDWFRLYSSLAKSVGDFYWHLRKLTEKYPQATNEITRLLENPHHGPSLFGLLNFLKTSGMSIDEWKSLARHCMNWLLAYLRWYRLYSSTHRSPADERELRELEPIVMRVPTPILQYVKQFGWFRRLAAINSLAQQMYILEMIGQAAGMDPRELAFQLYAAPEETLDNLGKFLKKFLNGELMSAIMSWLSLPDSDRLLLKQAVPGIEKIMKRAISFRLENAYLRGGLGLTQQERTMLRKRIQQMLQPDQEYVRQRLQQALGLTGQAPAHQQAPYMAQHPAPPIYTPQPPSTAPVETTQISQQTQQRAQQQGQKQEGTGLTGLPVVLPTGEVVGTVTRIQHGPRGELLQIWFRTPDGTELAIQPEFAKIEKDKIVLNLPTRPVKQGEETNREEFEFPL